MVTATKAFEASGPNERGGLARSLGLFQLTFSGLGIILGAGIYSIIGAAAGQAGTSVWMAFVASGAVAFFTALSYAELATTYPRASAEFTYLERSFPKAPSLAVTVGVLVAFSGIATAAAVSIAFGGYLEQIAGIPKILSAAVLLALTTAINVVGTKQTASVTTLFSIVASVSSFAALVSFIALDIALVVLRKRDPDTKRPFRVPLAIGRVPVLPILGALASVGLMTQLDGQALLVGGVASVVVFGVDLTVRKLRARNA